MAQVTVTLPTSRWIDFTTNRGWTFPEQTYLDLGTSLSTDGATTILLARVDHLLSVNPTQFRVSTAAAQNAAQSTPGPDFSSQMESSGTITLVASNGDSVAVTGIGDATEPYQWTPSNIAAIDTFFDTVAGLTDKSAMATFNDNAAPAVPGTPTVSGLQRFQATINWVEPANNPTSYDLQWRQGTSGNWTDVSDLTGLFHTLTGLSANTQYQARVRASNAGSDSNYSGIRTFTTTANQAPTVVIGTQSQTVDSGFALQLSAAVSDPEGDTVGLVWVASGNAGSFSSLTIEEPVWTAPTITSGGAQSFTLTLTATDQFNVVGMASVTITVRQLMPPSVPSTPTTRNVQSTEATIQWVVPSGQTATYDLQWREGSTGAFADVPNLPTPSYILTGLTPNTDYQVQVRAKNAAGTSAFTAVAEFRTRPLRDYALEVDWDNDNTYSNTLADVWPYIIRDTFQCKRGRNFPSQRTGRSLTGTLSVRLDNRDGTFDPLNTAGPLYRKLYGGRRVRFRMADADGALVSEWTGWLDAIKNVERGTGLDEAELTALGVISRLDGRVTVDQHTNINTGDAAKRIFDPDGTIGAIGATVDGADYLAARFEGTRIMARWWANDIRRLDALRELESTEGGFLHEDKDGYPAMDDHDNRLDAGSRVNRMTLTDGDPLTGEIPVLRNGITPDQPLRDLANRVTTRLRVFGAGNEQVLWSAEDIPVAAGATVELLVEYPTPTSPVNHLAVDSWITPVAGTDYIALNNMTITMTTVGNQATVSIANTGATALTTDLQVRGTPLIESDPLVIRGADSDSIAAYGLHEYVTPAQWLSSIAEVADLHEEILRIHSEPFERLTVQWEASSDLDQAAYRDLSDRVRVKRRDTSYDYFIESIQHQVRLDWHIITFTLSPASPYGTGLVLDTGPGLDVAILGP